MINYTYDGSFEGLLTVIYEAYYRRQMPENILPQENLQQHILCENVYIETQPQKADKVYDSIRKKISSYALRNVFYVFLSELEGVETWIYNYLRFGWQVGKKVDHYETDDRVLKIHAISRKVGGERHRMLGLVRFRQLHGDIYYAPIEPNYNIVGILAPHFYKRFSNQNWVLHDVKRSMGAVYNKREWVITEMDIKQELIYTQEELLYQKLWKQYFDSIAIKSKMNPVLQRRCMPARYWKYLIEKS